jgi:hypothetical protein
VLILDVYSILVLYLPFYFFEFRGLALVVINAVTTKNYCNVNMPTPLADALSRVPGHEPLHHYIYPLSLLLSSGLPSADVLSFIKKEIEDCRKHVPPYMSGSYQPIGSGTRACDYEDVSLGYCQQPLFLSWFVLMQKLLSQI